MPRPFRGVLAGFIAILALVVSGAAVTAAPKPSAGWGKKGAVFTTNDDCSVVNQNRYELNEDVYISGGPRKPGSASLLDGSY